MAETLLFGVAGKILGELSSPATQEIVKKIGPIFSGIEEDLEKLESSVSAIKAVLLDAVERQRTNHEVRDWLEKLGAALYEADDLLDDFNTEVLRRKVMTRNKRAKKVRIFFSRSNQLAFRFKMGSKLGEIRESLDSIAKDRLDFHFSTGQPEKEMGAVNNRKRAETHFFVRAENVIGREEDKNAIIECLLESNVGENVSVIPIVGIGGLGKTALAQLVYNDEKVKNHFELRLWVCVSDVFDVKLIAQNIIGNSHRILPMGTVINQLQRLIEGKKYFLVLDDVWNEDRNLWLQLRELLMGGASGSKILLTTRTQLVAKVTGTVSPYHLQGLSESESWSLFRKMAFERGVEPENPTLLQLGKEIVKKCVGVPLAIRTVGGLLFTKDTVKEWSYFKDNELSKITDQSESDIFSILKLSYDYLPPYLKQCFAYCSVFPKDHKFDKRTLIQLWIAHGFIESSSDERRPLEDVGDQYFMELLRRSFFQVAEKRIELDYVDVSCKMHDLIHDLALLVVGGEICAIGSDAENVVQKTRHVSVSVKVQNPPWEMPNCLVEANKLRTFLLQGYCYYECQDETKPLGDKVISVFRRLRAFGFTHFNMREVPRSICELRHLRFLDLSGNKFNLLPESICRLHNLQTLKLTNCHLLEELPNEIKNLVSLRHLDIQGCLSLRYMPRGLGQLTSLQTLTDFVTGERDRPDSGINGDLSELESLVNLRGKLRVVLRSTGFIAVGNGQRNPNQYSYLAKLEFLESLELEGGESIIDSLYESLHPHPNLKELIIDGYGVACLPSWSMADISFSLPNLVRLEINGGYCKQPVPFRAFGKLQSLQYLEIRCQDCIYEDCISEEEEVEDCGTSTTTTTTTTRLFPSLKQLVLFGLSRLKSLPVRHLTALESLDIKSCVQLDLLADDANNGIQFHFLRNLIELDISDGSMVSLPVGLQYLTNLQSLRICQFGKLTTIPEWIGNLESLQTLQFDSCTSLESLKGLRCLTALGKLTILSCPKLDSIITKETGEEWPNIAHIPHIKVCY